MIFYRFPENKKEGKEERKLERKERKRERSERLGTRSFEMSLIQVFEND